MARSRTPLMLKRGLTRLRVLMNWQTLVSRRAAETAELAASQQEREVSPEEAVGRTSGSHQPLSFARHPSPSRLMTIFRRAGSQEWREARQEMGCTTAPLPRSAGGTPP
jgi:hypothetical protein